MDSTVQEEAPQAPVQQIFGVGPTLRSAREGAGKSIEDCSAALRIRKPYLVAMEEGRHRELPGGTYAVGFLRAYADHLGLDAEEMVRRFRQECDGEFTNRADLVFPSPVSEGRVPSGAIIFVGVVLAVVAYGAWYWLSSRDEVVTEAVPGVPERLTTMLNRPATLTGEKQADPAPAAPATPTAEPAKTEVVPPSEDDGKGSKPADPAKPPDAAKTEPAKPAEPPKKGEAAKPADPVKPSDAAKAPEAPKTEAPKTEPAKPAEPPKKGEAAKPADPVKPSDAAKAPEAPKTEAPKTEPAKAPEAAKPAEPPKKAEAAKPADPAPAPAPASAPASAPTADSASAAAPAAAPENRVVFGQEYGSSRVSLRATDADCWLQVRETDGSLLVSRLLRKGDVMRLPDRPGLVLMVGNAGALAVAVDGKSAPALGQPGQVRRDIRLDPDKLMSGG